MITVKPLVFAHRKKRDGTYPVTIRVTFARKSRYLPTTITCTAADVTRGMKIKSASVLARANEICDRLRMEAAKINPFDLQGHDVDWVVDRLRAAMAARSFQLDFFEWAEVFLKKKREGNRRRFRTALNVFARYLGRDRIDINDITHAMLVEFLEACDTGPKLVYSRRTGKLEVSGKDRTGIVGPQYLSRLACVYDAAKARYNDEDGGVIVIPRSPFRGLDMRQPAPRNGQKPQEVEVIQAMIDTPLDDPQRFAVDVFLVGFCTMGANMADLYEATPPEGQKWAYFRRKTRERRADHAPVVVVLEPEFAPLLARLGAGTSAHVWLPALRAWKDASTVGKAVNRGLTRWCEARGIKRFTFYACRHTWGTLARRCNEKATVADAMGHVGEFRITDIYAERDWEQVAEANRRVLALFRWP